MVWNWSGRVLNTRPLLGATSKGKSNRSIQISTKASWQGRKMGRKRKGKYNAIFCALRTNPSIQISTKSPCQRRKMGRKGKGKYNAIFGTLQMAKFCQIHQVLLFHIFSVWRWFTSVDILEITVGIIYGLQWRSFLKKYPMYRNND